MKRHVRHGFTLRELTTSFWELGLSYRLAGTVCDLRKKRFPYVEVVCEDFREKPGLLLSLKEG